MTIGDAKFCQKVKSRSGYNDKLTYTYIFRPLKNIIIISSTFKLTFLTICGDDPLVI